MEKTLLGFEPDAFTSELMSILDWWEDHMTDHEQGGFLGRIDGDGNVIHNAPKGVILNTRILWTFSAACNLGFTQYRSTADSAFNYLKQHFVDKENGGVYWMLDHTGNVIDGKKQTYAQAFAIYAFAEYHQLSGSDESLELATSIFNLLRTHVFDGKNDGYLECLSMDWRRMEKVALSEKEGNDTKTMNTHLHLMEAFTNLARCSRDNEVMEALSDLVSLYLNTFIDGNDTRLKLFFDEEWNENFHHHSFGHEIESAWLLREACHVLDNPSLQKEADGLSSKIADRVMDLGLDDQGALYNELSREGKRNTHRDWWLQAEAVVGFFDAYQTTYHERYLDVAIDIWTFIQLYIKDYDKGEWLWACDEKGIPDRRGDKAGPWKAPYHNGRMCMEMIRRLSR